MKSQKNIRNPYYKTIPSQQVIPNVKAEPEITDYDEFIVDYLIDKEDRKKNVTKQSKTRQRKRNNRYAKEERIYGE